MEAPPIPIAQSELYTLKNDNEQKIVKKEYNIEINNEKYNLLIFIDNKLINIKIYNLNNMEFIYYENKFNLTDIYNILYINSNICNNLEEVIELIDSAYKNKKIIVYFSNNNIINIKIKYPIACKEQECIIKLNKKEIDINDKFKNILKEIMLIKKEKDEIINDKLNKIEQLLLELKDYIKIKLEENKSVINEIKSINEKLMNNIEKNKEEIKLLKNEIFIKEIKEYYKKYNLNKEVNIYKLDLKNKGIGDNDMEIKDLQNIYFKELKELDLSHNNISDINVLEKVKFINRNIKFKFE